MTGLNLLGAPQLIHVVIVVDDPGEGLHIASKVTLKPGEFQLIANEQDFRGLDPSRTVFIRGFVSRDLFDATEFFRQMGAIILDINYQELKRET